MDRLILINDVLSIVTPFVLAFVVGWVLLQVVRGH